MTEQVCKVALFLGAHKEEGTIFIRYWTKSQRRWRAVRFFIIALTATVCSVVIPVVHFITVPVGLLVAVVGPWILYSQDMIRTGGEALCPACKKPLTIIRGRVEWPQFVVCNKCAAQVRIEKEIDRTNNANTPFFVDKKVAIL